jgi:hypothetical protein
LRQRVIVTRILAKSFPVQVRYTGISLSYQICGMVFAGTTPILGQYLLGATGSILSVGSRCSARWV